MTAPSYWDGERTVTVKRSRSCEVFVFNDSFKVATKVTSAGTPVSPLGLFLRLAEMLWSDEYVSSSCATLETRV
jgi:hypothetical protein